MSSGGGIKGVITYDAEDLAGNTVEGQPSEKHFWGPNSPWTWSRATEGSLTYIWMVGSKPWVTECDPPESVTASTERLPLGDTVYIQGSQITAITDREPLHDLADVPAHDAPLHAVALSVQNADGRLRRMQIDANMMHGRPPLCRIWRSYDTPLLPDKEACFIASPVFRGRRPQ
jgi:hypothetical protein